MELRLGSMKRLRLDVSEVERLQSNKVIVQSYSITPKIQLRFEIALDLAASVSQMTEVDDGVHLTMSQRDLADLSLKCNEKDGITVCGFNFQIDLRDRRRSLKRNSVDSHKNA